MIRKLLLLIFWINIAITYAQKELGSDTPEVKVLAHATKNKIYLRWGVNTPTAWRTANRLGYSIERKTIVRDEKIVPNPETIVIKKLIKPKPLLEWKEFTEKNNYAAVAAQALYGDDFDVNINQGDSGVISILNQSQVAEQRFSFALYAADQNFEVAKFLGLGFIDENVKPNERYLYTIKVLSENNEIKSGGIFLGLSDRIPLPKPQEFSGVFKDKTVLLSWNYEMLKRYYNSYIVEKSEDNGITFKPVTATPITKIEQKKETAISSRIIHTDSIAKNDKIYKYRVKGISPFGFYGPYSDVISGKGIIALRHNPFITKLVLNKSTPAILNWEFPKEGVPALKSFELLRANKLKGNYSLVKSNISKNTRSIQILPKEAISYYKIVAVGKDGTKRESFPKMMQPDDATPPAIPTGLIGTIDSTGVVTLDWNLNIEPDFLGYRVFRAHLKTNEFTQITFEPTPNNTIKDTINLKTLNKEVFYKVQSFDTRYNPSDFSEVLILKKPDIVPPSQPVFSNFKVDKGVVNLQWINSSSRDAKNTMLYRKEKGVSEQWQLIKEAALPENSFVDNKVMPNKTYLYTILAVDESGLESKPITPIEINIADDLLKPAITKFNGEVNREAKEIVLRWSYKEPNVKEYMLYKAIEGKQPTTYKIFESNQNSFADKRLTINSKYTYLLQAVFVSGAKSPIKKIELNY